MKISLIMCTIGRTTEIERLLQSLVNQTYSNFELIIVDQNEDNRLEPLLKKYEGSISITYLNSERGLSKARNKGLKYVTGDIVAFPDDDCWYPDDFFQNLVNLLSTSSYDGITCRSVDEELKESNGKFSKESGLIDFYNVWNRAISYTIFIKASIINKTNPFDESLGVGSGTIYGSGEETDFIISRLKESAKIFYSSTLYVFHSNPIKTYDSKAYKKAYYYGCGMGRVLKKHSYPLWYKLRALIRPLGGFVIFLLKFNVERAIYYWYVFRGRLKGMLNK